MAIIHLKPGRERSVWRRHPWIFSGAINHVEGTPPEIGETVDVFSANGQFLARAAYSPNSQIRARVWTWDKEEQIDINFFRRRLSTALDYRRDLIPKEGTNAYRIIHAESDGLPGLVVDKYGDVLVIQCLSAGVEKWRTILVDVLCDLTGMQRVFERSDVEVRRLEGLSARKGNIIGHQIPERIKIQENDLKYWVDVVNGQKTGFFLDQRPNRQLLREMIKNRKVLDCFCYTGGFTINALAGGAKHILSVDSSEEAIELGEENVSLNSFQSDRVTWLKGDVFEVLRSMRDRGETFDAIILDPPKFAPTASHAEQAARGYKDINLLGFKLLNPGGLLFTFSCSGGISFELFQKIVTGAALDAKVETMIVRRLSQGPDHPISLYFPEGAYLKGLVCYVRRN